MVSAGWDTAAAAAFRSQWLPAWTGGDADRLLSFYTDDAFYRDPAIPDGLEGKEALRGYFARLLARYPDWRWTHRNSLAVPDGFLNYWEARLTGAADSPSWQGVCVVQLRDRRIFRNEVFFDRPDVLRVGPA